MSLRPRVLIIAGPTASGKSALALEKAHECGGVIINADSMQVYDALPLLTARPSDDDLARAPHRLYGFLHPKDSYSAASWRTDALGEIAAAHNEGRLPIIVGGTGFYIKALTEGLSPVPDIPDTIRQEVTALQAELGNPAFHAELEQHDPDMAVRLHPNDTQRLIRAYEVMKATGKSLAWWQSQPPQGPAFDYETGMEILLPERQALYRHCDERFEKMLEAGALEEVERLSAQIDEGIVPETALVTNALGFKALRAYLKGAISREEAIERAQTETRQYAKRQITWFRHQHNTVPKTV